MVTGLNLESLGVEYGGPSKYSGVHEVSLSVPSSSIAFVVGRNGSGKSSLLNAVAARVRYTGRIAWNGITTEKTRIRSTRYYPQDIEALTPLDVVIGDLFKSTGVGRKAIQATISQDPFNELQAIPEVLNRLLRDVSGGQRQLAVWAATMSLGGELFLFDETFRCLDPLIRERLWAHLVRTIESRRGVALVATHDLAFAAGKDANIFVMSNGRLSAVLRSESSTAANILAAVQATTDGAVERTSAE